MAAEIIALFSMFLRHRYDSERERAFCIEINIPYDGSIHHLTQ